MPERPHTGPLRILIADDHDVARVGLRALVESQKDWTVCGEAETGCEAVELALRLRPDVILLDFSMPGLNGLEATRQIHGTLPGTEILIVTMHDSELLAQELRKAGARGFLLKTDARRHLVPAVHALASHRPFFAGPGSDPPFCNAPASGKRPVKPTAAGGPLTRRQLEVLQLVAAGNTSKTIAKSLDIGTRTVEAHRAKIMDILDLHSVGELIRYAVRNKIVEI